MDVDSIRAGGGHRCADVRHQRYQLLREQLFQNEDGAACAWRHQHRRLRGDRQALRGYLDRDAAAPASGRRVAALSLAIWVVVVFLGRWVGFTLSTTAAPVNEDINFEQLENLIPK